MERRAVFVLLGLLYLAVGTLVTVQADVTYVGPAIVHEGQKWEIECNLDDDNAIRWTRNGQTLEPELSSGQLVVFSNAGTGTSKLSANQATESHDGDYKCTSDSEAFFHLSIYFDIKIRVLTSKDLPLVLECANKSDKVQWQKERTPLSIALDDDEDIVKIDNETGSLKILKDEKEAYGNYTCKAGNSTIEYKVVPRPIAHLAESTSVVEGEKLHLVCVGKDPSPGVKISWTFGDQNYTHSKDRVKISKDSETGIYGAVLIVNNIEMNDRGSVICRMSYNWSDPNAEHSSEAETFLRVKDKLAALWPFLGICVEVVVLCAIILVYEKKRNKAELEESDTDQSPDTKPTPNKESDVRQRK
ncbi:Neuroplastin-like isoform x2 protein [Camponotus japonicus]